VSAITTDHTHRFLVHTDSGVHRLAPECKVAATILFILAVVATPREAFWAFGLDALLVVTVALAAGAPLGRLARRLVIELPFLGFALLLPFVAHGERVDVWFLSLSVPGLWGAWNILVKATLGVAATALLGATTSIPELLRALERLRVPRSIVAIAGFMIRYGDLLRDDLRRMRIARQSRGGDPRWLWQAGAVAASAGTLFVRAYERGERVYVAMLARGYGGVVRGLDAPPTPRRNWLTALAVPATASIICVAAVGTS
jgi:cobalt/nickel transport system permease protein